MINSEDDHDRIFGKRYGDTGQWLVRTSKFQEWQNCAGTALLWCHGGRKLRCI